MCFTITTSSEPAPHNKREQNAPWPTGVPRSARLSLDLSASPAIVPVSSGAKVVSDAIVVLGKLVLTSDRPAQGKARWSTAATTGGGATGGGDKRDDNRGFESTFLPTPSHTYPHGRARVAPGRSQRQGGARRWQRWWWRPRMRQWYGRPTTQSRRFRTAGPDHRHQSQSRRPLRHRPGRRR